MSSMHSSRSSRTSLASEESIVPSDDEQTTMVEDESDELSESSCDEDGDDDDEVPFDPTFPQHPAEQAKAPEIVFGLADPSEPVEYGCCGWALVVLSWVVIALTVPFSLILCIKVVQEYERAVIFRLGRLLPGGAVGPGMFFVVPCIDSYRKIDLRVVSFDVPPQEILSKDSVTVAVDAVVYFRISNATISVTNVEDAARSTKLLAQTTLRNILGTKTLAEMLSDREAISHQMQSTLDDATDPWGVKVERVEVKDVRLPVQLQRAMAAEAEAAREARAKVIAAEGEQKASRALKMAADVLGESPAAIQLRYLQTLTAISAEKNSTIIFPLPVDLLGGLLNKFGIGQGSSRQLPYDQQNRRPMQWPSRSPGPPPRRDGPAQGGPQGGPTPWVPAGSLARGATQACPIVGQNGQGAHHHQVANSQAPESTAIHIDPAGSQLRGQLLARSLSAAPLKTPTLVRHNTEKNYVQRSSQPNTGVLPKKNPPPPTLKTPMTARRTPAASSTKPLVLPVRATRTQSISAIDKALESGIGHKPHVPEIHRKTSLASSASRASSSTSSRSSAASSRRSSVVGRSAVVKKEIGTPVKKEGVSSGKKISKPTAQVEPQPKATPVKNADTPPDVVREPSVHQASPRHVPKSKSRTKLSKSDQPGVPTERTSTSVVLTDETLQKEEPPKVQTLTKKMEKPTKTKDVKVKKRESIKEDVASMKSTMSLKKTDEPPTAKPEEQTPAAQPIKHDATAKKSNLKKSKLKTTGAAEENLPDTSRRESGVSVAQSSKTALPSPIPSVAGTPTETVEKKVKKKKIVAEPAPKSDKKSVPVDDKESKTQPKNSTVAEMVKSAMMFSTVPQPAKNKDSRSASTLSRRQSSTVGGVDDNAEFRNSPTHSAVTQRSKSSKKSTKSSAHSSNSSSRSTNPDKPSRESSTHSSLHQVSLPEPDAHPYPTRRAPLVGDEDWNEYMPPVDHDQYSPQYPDYGGYDQQLQGGDVDETNVELQWNSLTPHQQMALLGRFAPAYDADDVVMETNEERVPFYELESLYVPSDSESVVSGVSHQYDRSHEMFGQFTSHDSPANNQSVRQSTTPSMRSNNPSYASVEMMPTRETVTQSHIGASYGGRSFVNQSPSLSPSSGQRASSSAHSSSRKSSTNESAVSDGSSRLDRMYEPIPLLEPISINRQPQAPRASAEPSGIGRSQSTMASISSMTSTTLPRSRSSSRVRSPDTTDELI